MLPTLSITGRKAIAIACLAIALTPATVKANSGAPRAGAAVHMANGMVFNWLAPKKSAKRTPQNVQIVSSDEAPTSRKKRYFGKGSYICSPAGFGSKSRCFAR